MVSEPSSSGGCVDDHQGFIVEDWIFAAFTDEHDVLFDASYPFEVVDAFITIPEDSGVQGGGDSFGFDGAIADHCPVGQFPAGCLLACVDDVQ